MEEGQQQQQTPFFRNYHPLRFLQQQYRWSIFLLLSVPAVSLLPPSQSSPVFDYREALTKSLLYFESQRSGRLPHNQRVSWRSDSGLTDGLEQGVDLVGGYYDAGDNVKFGLPMAFTITMLSWGVIEYRQQMADAGELGHALEAIKWGTDYFIKAHTHPNVLWVQVGDGDTDHYCWQRPEDMTTSRRAYKVDAENPGSEVAAETAAAMAAAAMVFRETNPHYSQLLLHHARQLFEFGEKYRGKYDESVMAAKGYYTSVSGYGDELLWAAAWLYRATTDTSYMDFLAGSEAFSLGGVTWAISEFSWDLKFAGLQLLSSTMLEQPGLEHRHKSVLEQYRSKAEHYICACMDQNNSTSNVHRTPGGLLYTRAWNNMQYVSAAAFLLAFYSDHLRSTGRRLTCSRGVQPLGPEEILGLARSQVDYILGGNPMGMSYLVGFGRRYPRQVHHRGASTEAYRSNRGFIGCTQGYDNWFGRKGPNPNVVVGALVGGPDKMDRFKDKRSNYAQTEACTYNTAALVGVLAKLCGLDGDDSSALSEPLVYSA